MDPLTDIEKLRRLIPHWIAHNRSHAAEFVRWAELARAAGAEQTAALIENAAVRLQEADLSAALEKAGGPRGARARRPPSSPPRRMSSRVSLKLSL